MIKDIKICANCKFYVSYYTLGKNKLHRVNDGCCVLSCKGKKHHPLMDSCEKHDLIIVDGNECLDDISKQIYQLSIDIESLSELLTLYRNNSKN